MIHPTAIIYPGVDIGEDVYIGPFCVIGARPEHREFYDGEKENKGVRIESGARISSHVTIDAGTEGPTIIGKKTAIFQNSHIAHDCRLGDAVTVGGKCSLAGHTVVQDGATISGHSCTFQRTVIGAYSFVGAMSFITRDIGVAERFIGYRPCFIGWNDVGLMRAEMSVDECLKKYKEDYDRLVASKG